MIAGENIREFTGAIQENSGRWACWDAVMLVRFCMRRSLRIMGSVIVTTQLQTVTSFIRGEGLVHYSICSRLPSKIVFLLLAP